MSMIHQLYATHCTYGSSAIERRTTGDSRDRVLGYSARASSFSQSDLRRHFRTIERFLYYYLPKETPPDKKQNLTPEAAPHRFFFSPSMSGLQALGYISYRQTDRAGRVGSYFAHILTSETKPPETPWDVIECLQTWNAPGWKIKDDDAYPHDLPTAATVPSLRGGTPSPVDERVLWSFLNTPPNAAFDIPDPGVIPPRWRAISVDQRRRAFRQALMGYLEIADQPRDSLLVLTEPAVAVLFFYGIARLLPPALRTPLSFSTFETNADRLVTSLAAMTFDNESSGGDVPPERYRRGFVVNTWLDKATDLKSPNAKYADFVLESLVGVRPSDAAILARSIDEKLARFREAGVTRAGDLEDMVQANAVSEQVLGLTPQLDHKAWQNSPTQLAYVRKAIRQRLAGPLDKPYLDRVLQSPEYLPLMLEIAVQGEGDDNCGPAIAYLVEQIPLARLDKLLGPGEVARSYKLHALRYYVASQKKLPDDCDWFWSERSPAAQAAAKPPLALDLFQSSCVTAQLIKSSVADVPEAGLHLLFRSVVQAPIDAAEKRDILGHIAVHTAFDAVALMPDLKTDMSAHGPLLKKVLLTPLRQALNRFHKQPKRFADTVGGLEAALPLLAGDPAEERIKGWVELKRTLESAQREKQNAVAAGIKARIKGTKAWDFADKICRCADHCFAEADTDGAELRVSEFERIESCLRTLASMYQVEDLLPGQFKVYLRAFLTHQAHTLATLKKKSAGPDWQELPWKIPAMAVCGVVALVLLWMLAGPVLSWFSGGDGPGVVGGTSVPPDDGTGQSQTQEDQPPSVPPADSKDVAPSVVEVPKPAPAPAPAPAPGSSTKPQPNPPQPAPGPAPPESTKPPGGANADPPPPAKKTPAPSPKTDQPKPKPKPAPKILPGFPIAEEPKEEVAPDPSQTPSVRLCDLDPDQPIPSLYLHRDESIEVKRFSFASDDPKRENYTLRIEGDKESEPEFAIAKFVLDKKAVHLQIQPSEHAYVKKAQSRLRFCVLEVRDEQKKSSRFVALQKPRRESFPLEFDAYPLHSEADLKIQPGDAPSSERLCLGAGRLIHKSEGPYDFGSEVATKKPTDRWPLSTLMDKQGLSRFQDAGLKNLWIALKNDDAGALVLAVETEPDFVELQRQDASTYMRATSQLHKVRQLIADLQDPSFMDRFKKQKSDVQRWQYVKGMYWPNVAEKVGIPSPPSNPKSKDYEAWAWRYVLNLDKAKASEKFIIDCLAFTGRPQKMDMQEELEKVFKATDSLEADVYRIVEVPESGGGDKVSVRVLVIGRPK